MKELAVLHADNHVLAVAKPAGLCCVPDASGDPSLLEQAREWVRLTYAKPGAAWLGVVHRLDRPVSGVVLFARTSKAASRLSQSFRGGLCRKQYIAISAAEAGAAEGVLEQWLIKDEKRNRVEVVLGPGQGARLARTHWRVRARRGGLTLFELEPETGRPHQLRVALASLGAPLLGDLKYGAAGPLPDQSIALHAASLVLPHPTLSTELRVHCQAPLGEPWRFFAQELQ